MRPLLLQMALQLLFALVLLMKHADAASSPWLYWRTVLPNTPMPSSIRDFFYPPSATYELRELRHKTSPHQLQLVYSDTKPLQLQDEATFIYSDTKPHQLQDEATFIYSDTKPHQLQDEATFIYSDTKPYQLQDEATFIYSDTKPHQPQDEGTLIYSDTKPHRVQDEATLVYSDIKQHQQQDEVLLIYSDTKPHQLQDEASLIYSNTKPHLLKDKAATSATDIFGDKVTRSPFFLEKDLFPGANLTMQIMNHAPSLDLLTRRVADAFPFSSAKLPEVLALLSIDPNSRKAKRMRRTLHACEHPTIEGETKFCATSLESMVDFIVSSLGTNDVRAFATLTTLPRGAESSVQAYTVTSRLQKIADVGARSIACHLMDYAYAIFACHDLGPSARVYAVTIVGSVDKTQVEMIAMCHTNTAAWSPNHISFQLLNVKPGTEPICHLVSPGTLLWLPSDQNQELSRA